MASPLVSILMPCYNAAPWLAESIESALDQTWPDKELIIVNDGSTDRSGEIARSYESRGVRVIDQSNRGQSAAANRALAEARGDFVKYLDADDILSPESLSIQIKALEGRLDCIAMGEWARFVHDKSEALFEPRIGWHDAAPVDWIVETWSTGEAMMQCSLFLIPMQLLRARGGFDDRLSLINDFEMFARLLLASRGIVFTPGARLYYRSGVAGSLSARKSHQAWESAFLSITLGVEYLLARERSPRTCAAAAAVFQSLAYMMFPYEPKLVAELEARVRKLGGSSLKPPMGRRKALLARLIGWRNARRLFP